MTLLNFTILPKILRKQIMQILVYMIMQELLYKSILIS